MPPALATGSLAGRARPASVSASTLEVERVLERARASGAAARRSPCVTPAGESSDTAPSARTATGSVPSNSRPMPLRVGGSPGTTPSRASPYTRAAEVAERDRVGVRRAVAAGLRRLVLGADHASRQARAGRPRSRCPRRRTRAGRAARGRAPRAAERDTTMRVREAPDEQPADDRAGRRQQEQDADDVGDEARASAAARRRR